jgi:hypothetical protein
MAVKPITPAEALTRRKAQVPDAAVEALNEYLVMNYNPGSELRVTKATMHSLLAKAAPGLTDVLCTATVKNLHDSGWTVNYVVASVNEDFEPYYSITATPAYVP